MQKINELKKCDLNCNIFSVYDYEGLTMQELLCQFFTKINECIGVSNETIKLADWLVNEGLAKEVVKKLMVWLEDGTLENVINVNLFKTLNDKINDVSNTATILKESVYNIKMYGVKGDGTDETEAIQNFFNNLPIDDTLGGADKPQFMSRTIVEFPQGTYKFNNVKIRKYGIKLTGAGVVDGTFQIGRDEQIFWLDFEVDGLTFDHKVKRNSIEIKNARRGKITNCKFINSIKSIYISPGDSNYMQHTNRIDISNNQVISSDYFVYGSQYLDKDTFSVGDLTIMNNIVSSNINNLYFKGLDGLICSGNKFFMPGYVRGQLDNIKKENIIINNCNYINISNNSLFESGTSAINITKFQNVNIIGNNIAWSGQSVKSSAIFLGGYDNSGHQKFNMSSVTGNNIDRPSGCGIELITIGYVNVSSNQILNGGCNDFYNGTPSSGEFFGIMCHTNTEKININNNLSPNNRNNFELTNCYASNNVDLKYGLSTPKKSIQPTDGTKVIDVNDNVGTVVIAYPTWTKIVGFEKGVEGQEITVYFFSGGSSLGSGGNIKLIKTDNLDCPEGSWVTLKFVYGYWREISRSI